MKQRLRIYYTEAQKALMWDRWEAGNTLREIGKLFDRPLPPLECVFKDFYPL